VTAGGRCDVSSAYVTRRWFEGMLRAAGQGDE